MKNDLFQDRDFEAMGSKGGKARAKQLSPGERSAIARKAAETRWQRMGKAPPRVATHVGLLKIGELEIPCAVLDDPARTRVLSESGVLAALGLYRSGAIMRRRGSADAHIPQFLAYKNVRPFVDPELEAILSNPIWFRSPDGQLIANGFSAVVLPRICGVWLRARDEGVLSGSRQQIVGVRADILMRGFAETGIIALVDEATGFQEERTRDALAKILEAFIAKELQPWISTFPPEFYSELFRLKKWKYNDELGGRKPQVVGHLTNDLVYQRLAPGVLTELRKVNPINEKGRRRSKHHQWLTPSTGHPKLLQHLGGVVTVMKLSDTWDAFIATLNKTHPRHQDMPLFAGVVDPPEVQTGVKPRA